MLRAAVLSSTLLVSTLGLGLTSCRDLPPEALKEKYYIITCRKDSVEMCEKVLKNSCRIPISIVKTEEGGRVTYTVNCSREDSPTSSPSPDASRK